MDALSKYKTDLLSVLTFSFKEYSNNSFNKSEKLTTGQTTSIGDLSVKTTTLDDRKRSLHLRRYDVSISDMTLISYIVGHASFLFGHSFKSLREQLLANNKVIGVATIKQCFFEYTSMPAAIVIIGNSDSPIWLTAVENIDQLYELICGNTEATQNIFYTESLSADNMMPEYYNGDDKVIEERLSGTAIKELQEVATVISGKSASSREYTTHGIPYLRSRDIVNGRICKPDVYIEEKNAANYSRQLLQEGDILLTKHFGQNKIALVTSDDLPAIASNMLFILRPFDVSENYLYSYLTSKTGNEVFNLQMNRIKRGAIIPSVALCDLIHLKIPVYDENTMKVLERMDSISNVEAVETAVSLLNSSTNLSEKQLEEKVRNDLVAVGWDPDRLISESSILVTNDRIWHPDLSYSLDDGRVILIEIKTNITKIDSNWIAAINHILNNDQYILILTTGIYYEVHMSVTHSSIKMITPPSIESILNLGKEEL